MGVRALAPTEIEQYRAVRLAALRTDPAAFSSTYERERDFDDDTWTARLTGIAGREGCVFVDERGGVAVGLVGIGFAPEPATAILWGLWVDPAARHAGVGRRLVGATIDWARQRGAARVALAVVATNTGAVELYRRCGFVPAGAQHRMSRDEQVVEIDMELVLGAPDEAPARPID